MPTPTRSAESRSERLIRLAKQAAEDLQLGIKPDEASGTNCDQTAFIFTTSRGTGRIIVGCPGDDILFAGTLTRPDGSVVPLRTLNCREPKLNGLVFDRLGKAAASRMLQEIFRQFHLNARPVPNRKRDLQLLLRSGKKAGGDSPHDAPTQELAVVAS